MNFSSFIVYEVVFILYCLQYHIISLTHLYFLYISLAIIRVFPPSPFRSVYKLINHYNLHLSKTEFDLKFVMHHLLILFQVLWFFQNDSKEGIQSYPGPACKLLEELILELGSRIYNSSIHWHSFINFVFVTMQDTHNVRSVSFHPSGDFLLAGNNLLYILHS